MKFMRRPDLTASTRITIALEALNNKGDYGSITELAGTYKVSRTFIYSLVHTVEQSLDLQFHPDSLLNKQVFVEKGACRPLFFARIRCRIANPSFAILLIVAKICTETSRYIINRILKRGN